MNEPPALQRVTERELAGEIPPAVAEQLRAAIRAALDAGWHFDITDLPGPEDVTRLDATRPGTRRHGTGLSDSIAPNGDRKRDTDTDTAFRHVRTLGAGGFGDVVLARDSQLDRPVAIKTLHPRIANTQRERFLREARITAQLEHPNIVPVHQLQHEEGSWKLVMKFVDGMTLEEWAAQDPPPDLGQRVDVFARVCDAVAFAHSRGVLHRDLKPANVMVGEYGEVLVLDWGLARSSDPTVNAPSTAAATAGDGPPTGESDSATLDGTVMGTPAWMPPEQARGDNEQLDERSDLYSLGAILYFLLCGHPPFAGATTHALLARVRDGNPVPPSQRTDMPVPAGLERVVMRALAKEKSDRYASVIELQRDVRHGAHRFAVQSDLQLSGPTATPLASVIHAIQRYAWLMLRVLRGFHAERGELDEVATVNLVRMLRGAGDKGIRREAFDRMIVWNDHPEQLIERLVESGLAARREDEDGPLYFATALGNSLAAVNKTVQDGFFASFQHGLTDAELAQLGHLVTRLRECVHDDYRLPAELYDLPLADHVRQPKPQPESE